MNAELLDELLAALKAKRPAVLATRLPEGDQALLFPLDGDAASTATGWPLDEARSALEEDRSVAIDTETGSVFLRAYNPPVRLVVVGAVHIAAPLARMAALAGIDVYVVDPRATFASSERFQEVRLLEAWPDEALEEVAPDHRTAVVTLTHDAKLDDPGLAAALATPAFYVGALGSVRTHAKRLARLREQGVPEEDIGRIRAPVGLDLGARTPAEIAVAILAELVANLRRPVQP